MLKGTPYTRPQEIDLQFDLINHNWDNRPAAQFLKRYNAHARNVLHSIQDIRIGPRNEERLDVFPAPEPGAPILIFVHGGWWRGGTRKDWSFPALGFSPRGYTVVISDYTLCPHVTVPDITQATRAAVVWAYENAEAINGNRDRLFLAGHSAGGQQAAMIAVTDWTRHGIPADAVKGVVPLSAIFDMRVFQSCWLQPFLQLTGDTVQSESALFNIPDRAPPILIMLGEEESIEFHRQAEVFAEAWRERGHRADYFAVPGEDHSTAVFMLGSAESPVCERMAAFFESC